VKQSWSPSWNSSKQPRKQRKFRHRAPLHVRRKFLSAHLAKHLRESYKKRSMLVRSGDEVVILRGEGKGTKGVVEKVSIKKQKIYIEGVKNTKVNGSSVPRAIEPSNVMITKLKLDDKMRQAVIERRSERPAAKKPAAKAEKKNEVKKEKEGE